MPRELFILNINCKLTFLWHLEVLKGIPNLCGQSKDNVSSNGSYDFIKVKVGYSTRPIQFDNEIYFLILLKSNGSCF